MGTISKTDLTPGKTIYIEGIGLRKVESTEGIYPVITDEIWGDRYLTGHENIKINGRSGILIL